MALLRPIWMVVAIVFGLFYGAGDKWWPWFLICGGLFVYGLSSHLIWSTDLTELALIFVPFAVLSALGIPVRRRWGMGSLNSIIGHEVKLSD
jgi:integral membrane sensor domain MASE1